MTGPLGVARGAIFGEGVRRPLQDRLHLGRGVHRERLFRLAGGGIVVA